MDRLFKIHCSCIGKIMGRIGLTEKQLERMKELQTRKDDPSAKKLTQNMVDELASLEFAHKNPSLPETATSYLKQWYAGDDEQIFNKYLDKGNMVESDLIEFMADQLGFGLAEKNQDPPVEDEYFIGTCDVKYPKLIVDVKAMWNVTTLQSNIGKIDPDYSFQLSGYMRLYDKPEAILFYGLMNTPPECNYDREVIYDQLPAKDRWLAYQIMRDMTIEQAIVDRVIMCRKWLDQYDNLVTSNMGKVHVI